MNIGLVIGALTFGGAERVITNIANDLSKKGYSVYLISIRKSELCYKIDENVTIINGVGGSNKVIEIINLRKILKEINLDVVLSFITQINLAVLIASIGIKVPIIISERNNPAITGRKFYLKMLRNILYPRASKIVFQTEQARDYFRGSIRRKSTIIPNPIFIDKSSNHFEKVNKIVSIGRLVPHKRHQDTIKAFEIVASKYDEYILDIYGNGTEKEVLQTMIDNSKFSSRINLKYPTTRVHEEIQNAKIVILSSEYEGMPNALMECMAMGIVPISTDSPSGGPSFLIDHGRNGFLTEIGDYHQTAKYLDILISDSSKLIEMSKKSKEILIKLNPEKINSKWEKLFLEVSSNFRK